MNTWIDDIRTRFGNEEAAAALALMNPEDALPTRKCSKGHDMYYRPTIGTSQCPTCGEVLRDVVQ